MESLSGALERLSFNIHHAVKGRIASVTRPRQTARRATRARLGLECLETRDLMAVLPGPMPILLPPASLTATPISPTEVSLSWADEVYEGAVTVYEQNGTGGAFSTIASSLSDRNQSYTVTGLSPDSAYNFYLFIEGPYVGTVNGDDWYPINSTSSNVASVTTFFPLGGSPTLTATTASSSAVNLAWTPVSGAQQYTVSWWQNPGGQVQSALASPSTSQWQVTGLSPYTSYNFQVTANDGVNTSSASNVQTVTTLAAGPTFTAVPSATQISLKWNGLSGASDYVVYGLTNGTWQPISNVGTSLSYTDSGLTPYTNYELKVGANGPWGLSWSTPQNVMTLPPTVTMNASTVAYNQINLAWNSAPGTTEYDIYYAPGGQAGANWTYLASAGTKTSYSVNGLASGGTTWSFKIADLGAWGVNWSNAQTVQTPVSPPFFSIAASSSTMVNIGNFGSSGATSFAIDEMVNGVWQQIAIVNPTLQYPNYIVSGLSPDTTYEFKVEAFNSTSSAWGNPVSVTTFPAAPTVSFSTPPGTQANFTWTGVPGATTYGIAELESGVWTTIANLGSTATSYSVTGLSPDTTYSFMLRASNSIGTTWTSAMNVTTPPAAPVFTLSVASPTEVDVAWNGVAGASVYVIDEYIGGVLTKLINPGPNSGNDSIGGYGSFSYAVTGLSPDTTYQFQVYAVSLFCSSTANTETVTTPPAAPVFGLSATSAVQINVSWTAVAGATGYLVDEMVNGVWVQVGDLSATTDSMSVNGLMPNTSYEFRVAAVSPSGTTWSTAQSVRTPALPHIGPLPGAIVA